MTSFLVECRAEKSRNITGSVLAFWTTTMRLSLAVSASRHQCGFVIFEVFGAIDAGHRRVLTSFWRAQRKQNSIIIVLGYLFEKSEVHE